MQHNERDNGRLTKERTISRALHACISHVRRYVSAMYQLAMLYPVCTKDTLARNEIRMKLVRNVTTKNLTFYPYQTDL